MKVIEPCCAGRQMMGLRRAIAAGGTMQFEGYGDLSLAELIPAVLTRYSETELLIAAPSLPDQAAEALLAWMKKTWARMDGKGNLWRVQHLTVVADLSAERSPLASLWLEDNPLGERLTLVNKSQPDTAILLPDFAITGPVNMQYDRHFVAEATTDVEKVRNLWMSFLPKDGRQDGDGSKDDLSQESAGNGDAAAAPAADGNGSKDDLRQDAADNADAAESPADGGSQAGDAPAENGDGSKDDLQPESPEEKPARKKAARKA